ncbi:hypothetical protein [Sphingobium sp. R-21]|uniref:hypothetical protein n=1 Tax=Sphingobium sp. R-21 TaxID=3404056 RepID=UPI003CF98B7B
MRLPDTSFMVAAAVLPLLGNSPLLAKAAGSAAPAHASSTAASNIIIQGSTGFVIQKATTDAEIAPVIGLGRTIKLDSRLVRRSAPIIAGGEHALGQ